MDRLRQYCEERLPILYQREEQSWAGLRLHQELKAIQAYGQGLVFEDAERLAQLVRDQGGFCRLIGAGCSEVDPIFRTSGSHFLDGRHRVRERRV